MTPRRDDRPGLPALFLDMAATCELLGAPTYADLAAYVADEVASYGPLLHVLEPYADARIGDMVPLRFFGAVHRLVLERQAPELAVFYASVGGTPPETPTARAACRAALSHVVATHRDVIAAGLRWFPQTNEVGRTTALVAILRQLEVAWHLPVRLHEIGASAGLALRADVLVERAVVPAERPDIGPVPSVVERIGCDVAPIDPLTQDGRTQLTSFIWPDHVSRFERLRGALEVAPDVPSTLLAEEALAHVRSLRLVPGTALVVWHSAMWLYLPPEDRAAIDAALAQLGQSASDSAPLVRIALEPVSEIAGEQHVFHLAVTTWPGLPDLPAGSGESALRGWPSGMTVTLATTPPSGLPVSWTVPCVGGVVHDDRGRLLVIQRGQEPAKGRWSLPGGRVQAGESFADAVVREVREETGLDVSVGDMLGSVVRSAGPGGPTYDIRDFRAFVAGSPTPTAGDDAADVRWVWLSELRALPTSAGLLEALEEWDALPAPETV